MANVLHGLGGSWFGPVLPTRERSSLLSVERSGWAKGLQRGEPSRVRASSRESALSSGDLDLLGEPIICFGTIHSSYETSFTIIHCYSAYTRS